MSFQNNGEIDQSDEILQFLNNICMNDDSADVLFIIENTKIPAHKVILSGRSSYFQSLFFAGFSETKKPEIELKVPLDAFKAILKYIYTGCVSLATLESHQIVEIYDLANQYGFDTLKTIILEYLTVNLTLENCVSTLDAAHLYSLDDVQTSCMKFMDCHSNEFLDHITFKELPLTSLCALLKRDTFYAPEIDIFKAICNWSTNKPDDDIKEALSTVRWSELSMDDYLNVVVPSNILDSTQLLNTMNRKSTNKTGRTQCRIPYSQKHIEENFVTTENGAKFICGEDKPNFGIYRKYCVYHAIDGKVYSKPELRRSKYLQPKDSSIIVDLGDVRFINYIKMLLKDDDSRSYSYYIEISLDGKKYTRLFDHTKYYYRSWQNLYFKSRPVRFIKMVGTRAINIEKKRMAYKWRKIEYNSFDVMELQAMFTKKNYPEFVDGVIRPSKNVAKVQCGASIVQGGDGHNNMLNENPNKFTCHEVDSYILLQFGQPYYIDSLRMLLGNNMNQSNQYSFYIETSMNKSKWQMAVDKRNETLSGWQDFDFEPRPAIFIKITGTQSDNSFLCTYFECPRNLQKPKFKQSE
ncbi:BTB/POZ domain-containing protein 9-like [Sitodiplosis mosellana]|uniref:BTB/POZ domain-containing protein 9-like n=1 Tax=Sitodiplosis mosellana TaxID=263140 RepID=UPI00244480A9|nr:BTB/POZ domain-containing protein 9-like [Sitodiplosis mosellana]